MKKQTLAETNFNLWLLIIRLHHAVNLVRQRELKTYQIPARQLMVLRTINNLGPNATIFNVAKEVEREANVISRQTINMEKDGLIKRIKNTRKSNLLKLALTDKGLSLVIFASKSDVIDFIFSTLTIEERQNMASVINRLLSKVEDCNPY